MKLNTDEIGILTHMADKISPIMEFEVRFGLPIRAFGGDKNRISRTKFIEMLKHFRDSSLKVETSTQLDISHKHTNGYNKNNIRVTLTGEDVISEYCKTDKFDPAQAEIVYKDDYYWKPKELDTMINDEGIWTEFQRDNPTKTRNQATCDSDLGVRFSLKHEIPIVYSGLGGRYKYSIDPVHKSTINADKRLQKRVYQDLDEFQKYGSSSLKYYRYKRRFSFYSADKN